MKNLKVRPIILAAGKGTRMGCVELPKVLSPIKERPMISYLLDTLKGIQTEQPALVVGFQGEMVKQALGDEYIYVEQKEQIGTGHAVLACEDTLKDTADVFMVLYGDHPLWTKETLSRLASVLESEDDVMVLGVISSDKEMFDGYGRILRDENRHVLGIRERKDCTPEEALIKEVNVGIYAFKNDWLWESLKKIGNNNAQKEYYLTDLLEIAVKDGRRVATIEVGSWHECLGVNTVEQKLDAEKFL